MQASEAAGRAGRLQREGLGREELMRDSKFVKGIETEEEGGGEGIKTSPASLVNMERKLDSTLLFLPVLGPLNLFWPSSFPLRILCFRLTNLHPCS